MQITAFEGVVENGRIRLHDAIALAENTRVYVIVADPPKQTSAHIASPRLANPEQAGDFRKQILGIAADAKL